MLTNDEADELRVLQERVYGIRSPNTGDALADLRRIEELTRRRTDLDADELLSAPAEAPVPPPARSSAPSSQPEYPPKRRWPRLLVGGLTVGGIAFAVGMTIGAGVGPSYGSARVSLPEFSRPQTDEDVLNIPGSGFDPHSTRYIATTHGYDVFIGRNDEENLVCVILSGTHDDDYAAGCQDQDAPTSAAVSPDSNFSVGIGDIEQLGLQGDPIPLSESVTAYANDSR
jgi:hypothetical protein